jgi:hypothetical protein
MNVACLLGLGRSCTILAWHLPCHHLWLFYSFLSSLMSDILTNASIAHTSIPRNKVHKKWVKFDGQTTAKRPVARTQSLYKKARALVPRSAAQPQSQYKQGKAKALFTVKQPHQSVLGKRDQGMVKRPPWNSSTHPMATLNRPLPTPPRLSSSIE